MDSFDLPTLPTKDGVFLSRGDDGGWTLTISFSPGTYEDLKGNPRFNEFMLSFMALFHGATRPSGEQAS